MRLFLLLKTVAGHCAQRYHRCMKFGDTTFIRFQVIFWLVAGSALLASGIVQMQAEAAFVRNLYLTGAGFLASFFLAFLYERFIVPKSKTMLVPAVLTSLVVGFACTLSVNPITFLQIGGSWEALTWQYAVSGALNFSLVLFAWSLLFLVRANVTIFQTGGTAQFVTKLTVDDARGQRVVAVADIAIIRAAGDYVELLHGDKTDLRRGYLSDLENQLNPDHFVRIHRSFMINKSMVMDIIRKPKGQFEFDMGKHASVTSGRSFEEAVVAAFDLR